MRFLMSPIHTTEMDIFNQKQPFLFPLKELNSRFMVALDVHVHVSPVVWGCFITRLEVWRVNNTRVYLELCSCSCVHTEGHFPLISLLISKCASRLCPVLSVCFIYSFHGSKRPITKAIRCVLLVFRPCPVTPLSPPSASASCCGLYISVWLTALVGFIWTRLGRKIGVFALALASNLSCAGWKGFFNSSVTRT